MNTKIAFRKVALLHVALVCFPIFLIGMAYGMQSGLPFEAALRYVSAVTDHGFFPGQVQVVVGDAADPLVRVWNQNDQAWEDVAGDAADLSVADVTASGNLAVTGTATVTGAVTTSGAVTLGSNDADGLTFNGPIVKNVVRESFGDEGAYGSLPFMIGAGTFTPAVIDTGEIGFFFPGGFFMGLRWEQAYAGAVAFVNNGYLLVDLDDTENDGVDLTFGSMRRQASGGTNSLSGLWDEDIGNAKYCEASVDIVDISETDSFYFGWTLAESVQDAGAWASGNTYAYFVLSDAAGDLDIVTELNAGGSLNDDTGTTWADGEEKVLRVTIAPDSVSFTLDGAAVTQTNAVLNFDATDVATCVAGWLNAAGDATPDPDVSFNYVEIGVSQ